LNKHMIGQNDLLHRSLLQVATAQDELNTLSASVSSLIDPLSSCDAVNLLTATDSLREQIKRHETLTTDALKRLQYEVVRFNRDDELRVKLSALGGVTTNKKVCVYVCVYVCRITLSFTAFLMKITIPFPPPPPPSSSSSVLSI
jgi:hypothetical protein